MDRLRYTKSELHACVAGQRELLAAWMIENGFATGHGDTMDGLLRELRWQISERVAAEREACAKMADELGAKRRRLEAERGFGPATATPVANQYWCEEIAAAIRARSKPSS